LSSPCYGPSPRILLSASEQRVAMDLATARYTVARATGVADQSRLSVAGKTNAERQAMGAELAVCKAMNIYPDLSVGVRVGGYDCVLSTGQRQRLDVKWVSKSTHQLLATANKKQETKVDAYLLVDGDLERGYTLVGWAPYEELVTDARLVDLGYGPTYALPRSLLHPVFDGASCGLWGPFRW
jgi:hypothetical protein